MNENIIITFHKWDEASRKALMEKFGPLGIREEALMNDGTGRRPKPTAHPNGAKKDKDQQGKSPP